MNHKSQLGRVRPPGAPLSVSHKHHGAPGGRALPHRKPNVEPIFRTLNQTLAHGVVQNVVRLLSESFLAAQPMLEKVSLPLDAELLRRPFFPLGDNGRYGFPRRRERNQRMHMIRHQQKRVRIPHAIIIAERNGFEERGRERIVTQLILTRRLATDGQKVDFVFRSNPRRHVVRQAFTVWQGHAPTIPNPSVGRDRRARQAVSWRPTTARPAVAPYQTPP